MQGKSAYRLRKFQGDFGGECGDGEAVADILVEWHKKCLYSKLRSGMQDAD
jgi:hypothetical protein